MDTKRRDRVQKVHCGAEEEDEAIREGRGRTIAAVSALKLNPEAVTTSIVAPLSLSVWRAPSSFAAKADEGALTAKSTTMEPARRLQTDTQMRCHTVSYTRAELNHSSVAKAQSTKPLLTEREREREREREAEGQRGRKDTDR